MIVMVTGGSGSGKSEYAEGRILDFADPVRFYVATMQCADAESRARIERHRALRAGKGFVTVERQLDLISLRLSAGPGNVSVLLECLSNLAANEMFDSRGAGEDAFEEIRQGIQNLAAQCANLVVVTNEIFSDGILYDPATEAYRQLLGRLNRCLAGLADEVTEVVCGIPVTLKQGDQGP